MDCHNKNLNPRAYLHVKETTNETGKGLFTMMTIKKHEFIISYLGVCFYFSTYKTFKATGTNPNFVFKMPSGYLIDATRKGNHASYINHSCNPNAIALTWDHKQQNRIFIFSLKDIKAGTEITFDYKKRFLCFNEKVKCKCGSGKLCSGVMGISLKDLKNKDFG
jgi:SET domain-containing protein